VYPLAFKACKTFNKLWGTFNKAAVPVAPYPGGNPYKIIATFRFSGGVFRS